MAAGRRVYSERFVVVNPPSGTATWHVPAGKRAVAKALHAGGYNTTGAEIWCGVNGAWPFVSKPPATTFGLFSELRLVAYAGEFFAVQTVGSGSIWAHLSGYLFDDDEERVTQLPAPPTGDVLPPWGPGSPSEPR